MNSPNASLLWDGHEALVLRSNKIILCESMNVIWDPKASAAGDADVSKGKIPSPVSVPPKLCGDPGPRASIPPEGLQPAA